MVQCPKEQNVALVSDTLPDDLTAECCPDCGGAWVTAERYLAWQAQHRILQSEEPQVAILPSQAEVDFQPSAFDNRAGLCPDCKHYLVRGRIQLKQGWFFIERCPNCKGYWCDRGEWNVLQQLQLNTHLDYIFMEAWQTRVKQLELAERERSATVEKLGSDIADKIFELATLLEAHPNGYFGVAYLMRRFEKH